MSDVATIQQYDKISTKLAKAYQYLLL